MFFYISFLRTPPLSSLQSSPIVFTPQVSNDLRTEPFPTSIDIFYWWISCTSQNLIRFSEPAKLTTWRQENAYKPLQVPPPSKNLSGVAGMDCCLVLSLSPTVASSEIDLRNPDIGRVPLPVRSLPIRLTSPRQGGRGVPTKTPTASTTTTKQEAITRTFRLFGDEGATPTMQIKETVSFDLDKVTRILPASLSLRSQWGTDGPQHRRNCGTVESVSARGLFVFSPPPVRRLTNRSLALPSFGSSERSLSCARNVALSNWVRICLSFFSKLYNSIRNRCWDRDSLASPGSAALGQSCHHLPRDSHTLHRSP